MSLGSIKTVTVVGQDGQKKEYDIKKGGVSMAMEMQGIFFTLLRNAAVDLDKDVDEKELIFILQSGLNLKAIERIKHCIVSLTNAPKIDDESFEYLDSTTVISIFIEAMNHTVRDGEKKS